MKKPRTAKQLANDERLRNRSKQNEAPIEPTTASEPPVASETVDKVETDTETMQRQINELMESNALLKAAILQKQVTVQGNTPQVNQRGNLIGVFEKYVLDPDLYPSPIERLAQEPRLAPLAFPINYYLEYDYSVQSYDTKQGINTSEPEFLITLWRNVLDDETNKVVKRYKARRMIFHEDPQAAMVIARDNNILIDKEDEKNFLNEMRYLRVRDWLFDIFWPKPAQAAQHLKEEVIGNRLVEVVTVNSEDSIDLTDQFAKMSKVL